MSPWYLISIEYLTGMKSSSYDPETVGVSTGWVKLGVHSLIQVWLELKRNIFLVPYFANFKPSSASCRGHPMSSSVGESCPITFFIDNYNFYKVISFPSRLLRTVLAEVHISICQELWNKMRLGKDKMSEYMNYLVHHVSWSCRL